MICLSIRRRKSPLIILFIVLFPKYFVIYFYGKWNGGIIYRNCRVMSGHYRITMRCDEMTIFNSKVQDGFCSSTTTNTATSSTTDPGTSPTEGPQTTEPSTTTITTTEMSTSEPTSTTEITTSDPTTSTTGKTTSELTTTTTTTTTTTEETTSETPMDQDLNSIFTESTTAKVTTVEPIIESFSAFSTMDGESMTSGITSVSINIGENAPTETTYGTTPMSVSLTTEESNIANSFMNSAGQVQSSLSTTSTYSKVELTSMPLESSSDTSPYFSPNMDSLQDVSSSAVLSESTPLMTTMTAQVTSLFTSGLTHSMQGLSTDHLLSSMSDTSSYATLSDYQPSEYSTLFTSSTEASAILQPSTELYTEVSSIATTVTPPYEDASTSTIESTLVQQSTISSTPTTPSSIVTGSELSTTSSTVYPTPSSVLMESTTLPADSELQRQLQELQRQVDDLNSTLSDYVIAVVILTLLVVLLLVLIILYFVRKRMKNRGRSPFHIETEDEPVTRRERNYMEMNAFSNIGGRESTVSLGEGGESSLTKPLKSFNKSASGGNFGEDKKLTTILDDQSTLIDEITEDNDINSPEENGTTFKSSENT